MSRLERSITKFLSEDALGPHVRLESPRPVPSDVDPEAWLVEHVLPRPPSSPGARGHRRGTHGYAWLAEHGLAPFVQRRFRVDKLRNPGAYHFKVTTLKPITHWTEGRDGLLLMEPIVLSAAPESIRDVLEEVATLFSAYRYQVDRNSHVRLAAYLLDGGASDHRAMAVERLSEAAHDVYDLSHAVVAAGFRDEVRTLGESSGLGGPLT